MEKIGIISTIKQNKQAWRASMVLKGELQVIVPNAARKRNQTVDGGSVEAVVLKATEMLLEH